ncbi:C-terminal processing protease CtpA/Prc, contains a PDZ domain [Aquimarina amphilecti]|uniref:C-terminal processing protease CtpA/Prc, contains a PDZ domain n=1 Tax=Aquimarina amphilecti TaxID=1038014 RepID=A0A1H7QM01_AQUAM|nr:S41 family peptidase [Aquimarina amphilecti]SEL48946.1 C-terminal processing protease CtpA/Prc, contains a PDZ domain [Aquimarina amphilecti]
MKKNITIIPLIFILLYGTINAQQATTNFQKGQILSDLDYLYHSLENTHFNLYAYTSKDDFERNYQIVRSEIKKDSFNLLETTSLLQKVISAANNAHTRIVFPGSIYMEYVQSGGTIFPLEIAFEDGKALVRKNWSKNDIKIGAELKSINGRSIDEVLQKIYPQISAERSYLKNAQIESLTLSRFYWQVFGEQKVFNVELFIEGKRKEIRVDAIKALEDFEMRRDDIINHKRVFAFKSKAAYLNPGSFAGNEDDYRTFIDSAFIEIKKSQTKNLIIDLRNNPGGNDSFSDYMVSYIAGKPFKWFSKFQLKTSQLLKEHVRQTKDTTEAFWKSVLGHKNGEIYDYDFGFYVPKPELKRFKGKVYVLVNRQSYSQSTVTAAQIQDYNLGVIVGEETAEYSNLYASIFSFKLPETGIIVDVPKGLIERINSKKQDLGVIPEIKIIDHLLDDDDEILKELLMIIHGDLKDITKGRRD